MSIPPVLLLVFLAVATNNGQGCQGKSVTKIERVIVKPSRNSNLCIRTDGSDVKLQLCSLGAQVFEKITVTKSGNGVQLKTVTSRKLGGGNGGSCLLSSSDDGLSSRSFQLLTSTCNRRNRFQVWKVRRVLNGFQVMNRGTKKCISADPTDGAILITKECKQTDENQSWLFSNVDNIIDGNNSSNVDTELDDDLL